MGRTTNLTHMIYHLQQAVQHAVVLREKAENESQGINAYIEILTNDLEAARTTYDLWLELERQRTRRTLDHILKGEDADGNPF